MSSTGRDTSTSSSSHRASSVMGPSYDVSVHWRGLSSAGHLLPNDKNINHWALKVGDRYYKLAYPLAEEKDEILKMAKQADLSKEQKEQLKKMANKSKAVKAWNGVGKKLVKTEGTNVPIEETITLRPGKAVPLKICRVDVASWNNLSTSKNSYGVPETRHIPMGSTTLSPAEVDKLACEVFDRFFEHGYFWASFNCQAFVCTLIFLIRVYDPDHRQPILYDDEQDHTGKRKYIPSSCIHHIWLVVRGEEEESTRKPKRSIFRKDLIEFSIPEDKDELMDRVLQKSPWDVARLAGVHKAAIFCITAPIAGVGLVGGYALAAALSPVWFPLVLPNLIIEARYKWKNRHRKDDEFPLPRSPTAVTSTSTTPRSSEELDERRA